MKPLLSGRIRAETSEAEFEFEVVGIKAYLSAYSLPSEWKETAV